MGNSATGGDVPSIEAQRDYWDRRWEVQRSPNEWQARRAQAILAMLRELSLRDPHILDVGCATGWMTNLLSEIGHAEGLDLSGQAIAEARSRHPSLRFTAGDIYTVPLCDEAVDVVVCQEVIAHVSDQPELIRRIAGVIKPGGYVVISAANKFVMTRMRDEDGVGVGGRDPQAHIKAWLGMKDLKHLLRPWFRVLRTTSVIPMGNRGVLRLVNSHKLEVAGGILGARRLEALKERLGLFYSIIALGQKRA